MEIKVIVVSLFQQNARILICDKTREAVIVDPGDNPDLLLTAAEEMQASLKYILATHGHIDHIGAVASLQDRLDIPFYIHKEDEEFVKTLPQQAMMFGLESKQVPQISAYIEDGDSFSFGQCKGIALHTPGHSRGGVSFLFDSDIFVGDSLFAGSIGRTDLPGGSLSVLKKSITEKIYSLADEVCVHPGHGPSTTVGHEKQYNPYVQG